MGVLMMPIRIQRKRSKGWKMPPDTVYVGRGSTWENPYFVDAKSTDWFACQSPPEAVKRFREYLLEPTCAGVKQFKKLKRLRGKNLVCWCPLDQPCHADVLLELANTA
jgi:hypothetical protein